jgi:hypothetical protein
MKKRLLSVQQQLTVSSAAAPGAFLLSKKADTVKIPIRIALSLPAAKQSVLTPGGGAMEQTCWFCVHADFHLDKPRALDVGICEWPQKPETKNTYEGMGKRI